MTSRPRPSLSKGAWFAATAATLGVTLVVSNASAHPKASSDEPTIPVRLGFRLGAGLHGYYSDLADPAPPAEQRFGFSSLAETRLGIPLAKSHWTGFGIRGGWAPVRSFEVAGGLTLRHGQLLQGTGFWYYEMAASNLRFTAGPHVSYLKSDFDFAGNRTLFGGELSVELSAATLALGPKWSSRVWLAFLASHALATATANDGNEGRRESVFKLVLTIDLERTFRGRAE